VHYGISNNRVNPMAGTMRAAIFNTFRRTRGQILYWGIPIILGYEAMEWAIERCVMRDGCCGLVPYQRPLWKVSDRKTGMNT
jgi:hypothetical protein